MLALELGCGYGRVLERLLPRVRVAFGIDTSPFSLCMAREYLGRKPSLCLACMDAVQMGFRDRTFDLTICIQNGICASRLISNSFSERRFGSPDQAGW